jgi:hypothetical protein
MNAIRTNIYDKFFKDFDERWSYKIDCKKNEIKLIKGNLNTSEPFGVNAANTSLAAVVMT